MHKFIGVLTHFFAAVDKNIPPNQNNLPCFDRFAAF
jgi:hypothetical protein